MAALNMSSLLSKGTLKIIKHESFSRVTMIVIYIKNIILIFIYKYE